jgi:hypothetical protein
LQFDPAVAAQQAFAKVRGSSELGRELEAAVEAEERFSSSAGEEASAAYRELVAIGERLPAASYFTEYLVYATWCHLMDETFPEHFERGVALCQRLLRRHPGATAERFVRLRAIEKSFRAGLGEKAEDPLGYDEDNLQSAD